MHLSISERFLLLVLQDKGILPAITADDNWLIAGGLLDLSLAGRLEVEEDNVLLKGTLPENLEHLRTLDEYLLKSKKRLDLVITGFTLEGLGEKKRKLFEDVCLSLFEAQAVEREEHGKKTLYPPKVESKEEVIKELRHHLLEEKGDPECLALVMLLEKSGHLGDYFSKDERLSFKEYLATWKSNPEIGQVAKVMNQFDLIFSLFLVFLGTI